MRLTCLSILSAVLMTMALTLGAAAQTSGNRNTVNAAINVAGQATIDNLMNAYEGERNTQARYEAYAKKADEEGYHQVASMFRAVARGEDIHAGNFASVLQNYGGTPHADVQTPVVSTTRENLDAAVLDEDHESTATYPSFIKQARKDRNQDAERAFSYSKYAEASHSVIYRQALDDLESFRGGSQNFFVCPKCGRTCVATVKGKCPVCSTPQNEFEVIH